MTPPMPEPGVVDAAHVQAVLVFVLWPLWLAAGVADWWCHRRTDIEHRSGRTEWALHLVQAAQLGLALGVVLLMMPNTLALTLAGVLVALHTATAWWDARYTAPRREIGPFEQQVHAVLLLVPVFAWLLLVLLHPEAWRMPEWRGALRDPPLGAAPVLGIVAVTLAVNGLPLLEEGLRCARARRGRMPA